mmetsp:Transcript_11007/g.32883  ORF Transcript_11007/g.32883 Transcript_11007/m.32883 type:complete len:255 (-) Transcript_11007:132-896(-)
MSPAVVPSVSRRAATVQLAPVVVGSLLLVLWAKGTVSASDTYCSSRSNACYPGTATDRNVQVGRLAAAIPRSTLDGQWPRARSALLAACLLEDNETVMPGMGYTGHCFNDFNHVDCCTMAGSRAHNENNGQVDGIAYRNPLGHGIQAASIAFGEEGSGSWCTCQIGADRDPPRDVCHVQFGSAIGFKLVWCPGHTAAPYTTFALVDDDGTLINSGTPNPVVGIPRLSERRGNFDAVRGSKYAAACEQLFPTDSQ